jgi:DNA-binding CsgD family transcriptional regulator
MDSNQAKIASPVGRGVRAWRFTPGANRYLGGKTDGFRKRFLETVERRLAVEGSPVVVMREVETPMIAHTFAAADADAKVIPFPSAVNVTVTRLDDLPVPSESILMRVFDLTVAEVRVAQGLARGHSLDETATRLGIKITTARTELASIFAKTATCRQGQLVAVLSHLAHTEC